MSVNKKPKMKICLIWPWGFEKDRILPLALGYLASNLNENLYDVHIIDNTLANRRSTSAEFHAELEALAPDVVGVSGWTYTSVEALETIETVRRILTDVVIIMGGIHASAYPDRVAQHPDIDYLIQGEGEFSFPAFLSQLNEKVPDWKQVPGLVYKASDEQLVKNPMEFVDDLDQIAWPDFDAINLERYLENGYRYKTNAQRNAPIWVTRGCPYRCTFCSAPALNGKPVRKHSVQYMTRFIRYLYEEKGIRWLSIIDDNFTFHVRYAKEYCEAIIALGYSDLKFGTPNGIRMQKGDPDLWKLMKRAGWEYLVIAPESGSEHTLNLMKKDLKLEIVPGIVDDIRAAGLKLHAFFILGYPGERVADIKKTGQMIKALKIDFPIFSLFQPLPGTPIYDDLVSKGEIIDGLLPGDAVRGEQVYKSRELTGFNVPLFAFRTYVELALKNPSVIPYAISLFGPRMLMSRVWSQFLNAVGIGKGIAAARTLFGRSRSTSFGN